METIRELRALLEESKAAVEDSEKRLEAKNRSINDMKGILDPLHPATAAIFNCGHKMDSHRTPVVLVTPLRNAQRSQSVSENSDSNLSPELDVQKESEVTQSPLFVPNTPSPVKTPLHPRPFPLFRESPLVRNNNQHIIPSTPEMITTKTEKNRVLRVMVTPIQKLIAKHTKTSLLRLRLTPNKSAASTPEKSPAGPVNRNTRKGKRKISEVDPNPSTPDPNSSKKAGKAPQARRENRTSKLKQRLSLTAKNKYNLRARR